MISHKCLMAYIAQYPYCEGCGYGAPGNQVLISDEDGNMVIEPYDGETDETFMDRLKRSEETGHNLFFEEWEKFEYIEGCDY